MDEPAVVARRLILRRFAAAAPVIGTFLLPSLGSRALARPDDTGPAAGRATGRHVSTQHTSTGHTSTQPTSTGHVSAQHASTGHAPGAGHASGVRGAPASARADKHPAHGAAHPAAQTPGGRGHSEPAEPLPVVMLDPGHGGKDPGAIGVSGTYEKHIALETALELRRQLLASGRYRVVLTRVRDSFIPLDDRVEMAQQHGASLFVSMHADAVADHAVRGASVYTLSHDASDVQSAMLAEHENSADRFVRRPRRRLPRDFGPEVSEIVMNMGLSRARADSVRMARTLVGSMDDDLPMLSNPERHAGFVVLRAGSIPSVLVEMGFMSNARDEAALRKAEHRRLVARAMHRAVDAYFGSAIRSAT